MRRLLLILAAVLALAVAAGPASARQAIVGGTVSAPGAWPWAAFVQVVAPDGMFGPPDGKPDVAYSCTGSLIGERWVLTAGHCVLLYGQVVGGPGFIEGLQYRIVIGETNVQNPDPAHVYTAGAGDVVALAPQAGGGADGDLALIRLDRPAPDQAVRIPGAGQTAAAAAASQVGTPATVVGWGLTDENGPGIDYVLRQVDVPIVSDADCATAYPTIELFGFVTGFDPTTMVCAGLPQGGKDACQGDSGGPLMVPDGLGAFEQIGITSWGTGCAEAGKPGVYARLSGLYGFILTSLAHDPVAPAGLPSATTDAVTEITRTGATVSGTVTPNGLATSYVIEVGPRRRYGTKVEGYAGDGSAAGAHSAAITGLKPGRTYHYRVDAVNVAGVVHGADHTFETRPTKVRKKRR